MRRRSVRNRKRIIGLISLLTLVLSYRITAGPVTLTSKCELLSDARRSEIAAYLIKRWKIGKSELVKLSGQEFVGDTCYQRLMLEGGSLSFPVPVYVAPDHRFIFGSLFDTAITPEEDARETAERTQKLLLADNSPSRGSPDARVTIVEFSDFECPFCSQFDEWMQVITKPGDLSVRLVYKHFPLPAHPWARDAAAAATCAGLQSPDSFWQLHDFIFKAQGDLTAANLQDRIGEFANTVPALDVQRLQHCVSSGAAAQIISRDETLAKQFHVGHTPTLFINGTRVDSVLSKEQLKGLIEEASKNR
jgi:protein-disulfide isomerase